MRESPRLEIRTNRVSRLWVLVPVKWIIPVPALRQQMVKIRFEALGVGLNMCGELGLREPLRKQDSRAVGGDDKACGCGSVVMDTKLVLPKSVQESFGFSPSITENPYA